MLSYIVVIILTGFFAVVALTLLWKNDPHLLIMLASSSLFQEKKNDNLCYCTQLPMLVVRVYMCVDVGDGEICMCGCVYICIIFTCVMHAPTSTLPLFLIPPLPL